MVGAPAHSAELRVSAAATLSNVLRELGGDWERKTGNRILWNFGASSTLARQISEGAPADLFASADEAQMDALDRKGLVDRSTRRGFLSNRLVVVVPPETSAPPRRAADLLDPRFRRIALAETSAVPAGVYAKEWLRRSGIWERLVRKVVPVDNVRAAFATVEAGEADAAVVYRTDAHGSRKVAVAFEAPAAESPRISHPFAVTTEASERSAARRFLDFLSAPSSLAVFERNGFVVLR